MSNPVPRTGRKRWHKRYRRNGGLISASRIVSHDYADEGNKGPWFRRLVRKREERFWRREEG